MFCLSSYGIGQDMIFRQTGTASYYADKLHGRHTANGERYSNKKYTAAHLTLPFGTKVKVTNLNNGKSVIVKINDRGPHTEKYCIDLSKCAAREIGVMGDHKNEIYIETLLDSSNGISQNFVLKSGKTKDSIWNQEHLFVPNQYYTVNGQIAKPKNHGFRLYDYKELNYTLYLANKISRYIAADSVYIQPLIKHNGLIEYTLWVGIFTNPKEGNTIKKHLLKLGINKPLYSTYIEN
jgi:rare lipoprotein A